MVNPARKRNANKANAKFSTGPHDASSTRLNALAHGILSKEVVIVEGTGRENVKEFEDFQSAMTKDHASVGALEEFLMD